MNQSPPRRSVPSPLFHLPFPRHNKTAFIRIELRRCEACGRCVAECPRNVFGMIAFFGHHHVHVDNAIACKGCRKCVAICPQQAITLQGGEESRTSTD